MNRKAHQVARYVVGWLCWVVPALTLAGCKGQSPTQLTSSCPSPSLIAWWKMDDPANSTIIQDSSGNNHNGTLSVPIIDPPPNPPWNSVVFKIPNSECSPNCQPAPGSTQALFFHGAYATVTHNGALNINPQCGLRIELWVQAPGNEQVIIGTNGYKLRVQGPFTLPNGSSCLCYQDPNTGNWVCPTDPCLGNLVFEINGTTLTLPGFEVGNLSDWQRVVVTVEPPSSQSTSGWTATLCRDTDGDDANGYAGGCTSTTVSSIATPNTNTLWIAPGVNVPPGGGGIELWLDEVKICATPQQPCQP